MTNETDHELSEIQNEGMRAAWEKWNRGEMGGGLLTSCQLAHEADRLSASIRSPDMQPIDMVMVASSLTTLAAALRRAETERDKALKQSAGLEIQAQDLRDRLVKAEAERDAQHDLVLRLTAERDAVSVVHACPPKGSGVMPCCGATPFEKQGERLTADPALVNCDRQRLIAENARLQKEHNAYVQRLSADALQVASKYQRDRDEARSQVATLELLRRGGK